MSIVTPHFIDNRQQNCKPGAIERRAKAMTLIRCFPAAALLLVGTVATAQTQQPSPAGKIVSIPVSVFPTQGCDGVENTRDDGPCVRSVLAYVPSTYRGDRAVAVHFALHGNGGDAQRHMSSVAALEGRYNELAERDGFIAVYAEGMPRQDGRGRFWVDCRSDIASDNPSIPLADDVAYIARALDTVSQLYRVDAKRIFVSGMSNGGMMTYRLASELGERFAGFSVTDALSPVRSRCKAPTLRRPMMITYGTRDPVMIPQGGCVLGDCTRGRIKSATDTIREWAGWLGAHSPVETTLPDVAKDDNSTVTRIDYSGRFRFAVQRVNGGGHTIPGTRIWSSPIAQLSGPKNRDVRGPDQDVEFFASIGR
jgi:polyhydroxybutyrate depolymerase